MSNYIWLARFYCSVHRFAFFKNTPIKFGPTTTRKIWLHYYFTRKPLVQDGSRASPAQFRTLLCPKTEKILVVMENMSYAVKRKSDRLWDIVIYDRKVIVYCKLSNIGFVRNDIFFNTISAQTISMQKFCKHCYGKKRQKRVEFMKIEYD